MLSTPQQGVRWALLSLSQRPRLLATWSRNALVSTTSKKGGGGPGRGELAGPGSKWLRLVSGYKRHPTELERSSVLARGTFLTL